MLGPGVWIITRHHDDGAYRPFTDILGVYASSGEALRLFEIWATTSGEFCMPLYAEWIKGDHGGETWWELNCFSDHFVLELYAVEPIGND